MALSLEWQHRIERWQDILWKLPYRPLGKIELEGFASTEYLTAEEAAGRDFRPMPEGTTWGSKWEYGWFRGEFILPSNARGKRMILRLDPGGESLVWVNGKIAGSIGWAHKEITVAMKGQPGRRYQVQIEAYAGHGPINVGEGPLPDGENWMPEPGPTQTKVGKSTFGVWLEEVYQLAVDFSTLFELRGKLDPLSLRVAEIDEGLMEATLLFDPELPEAELSSSAQAARSRLKPLLEAVNGSTTPILYGFGHAHIDVAWLWPWQETEHKMARTVINQLALFDEYPEFKFLQSQPHLYVMLRQRYPDLYRRLKAAVKAGRFIPDGSMWVEADTNLTGGEALIRQVMYGRRFFHEEFDVDSRVLWLPDVFGYSGALPQILAGCGCIGFATQKITWAYNGGDPFPYNTFWWEGIDGTAIPAHIYTDYNSLTRPNSIFDRWNTRLQKNGIKSMLFAFGWGDGGGGPTRDHLEFLRRASDLEGLPRVKLSSPAEFFADLRRDGLPKERYMGELYFQAHRGTYTSQARTKRGNRKAELALREAEFWGTAARAIKGFRFNAQTLSDAWTNLMLCQFHDILPGSSIHRVYEEAEATLANVIAPANQNAQTAAQSLARKGDGITVFNSLNWERTEVVKTGSGPVEVTVPACGWVTVDPVPHLSPTRKGKVRAKKVRNGALLENEFLRAEFNGRGEMTRLFDKESGREVLAGTGNRIRMFKDVPTWFDAWDLDSNYELQPVELDSPARVSVGESGPFVASLTAEYKLQNSSLKQEIRLRHGSRRLEFETTIDWQEKHKLLKVDFPVDIHASEAVHEIQFGHLRRPNHRSRPYDADRFEVSNHKWTALVEGNRGAAVLNDCKYGVSVLGNTISLTLLKSAKAPDVTADLGEQVFTYALYSWNGSLAASNVVHEAYELNVPLMVIPDATGEGWLFRLDSDNIILETLKPAEDTSQDIILRLYESKCMSTRCMLESSLPLAAACQTDMLEENPVELPIDKGKVQLEFRPFEIKTVRLKL